MPNENRPAGAASVTESTNHIVRPTPVGVLLRAEINRLMARVDFAEAVRRRGLQDALGDVLAFQSRLRAAELEDARPKPSDYPGQATPAELAERDRRLAAQAEALRNRATLLETGLLDYALDDGELDEVLAAPVAPSGSRGVAA